MAQALHCSFCHLAALYLAVLYFCLFGCLTTHKVTPLSCLCECSLEGLSKVSPNVFFPAQTTKVASHANQFGWTATLAAWTATAKAIIAL